MKFKILSSEKFDYMMLSRLIQDAKYFITYPELKHLWTHDLNKHIEEMKKQYNKLDPKPEWTSLNEIEDLAKQMKESYKNYWNERHPDNKIEAAEQPTTPKPTTTLPDNMTWAWDPKANQWVAVMKDNPVVTPPTYNPNNVNNLNSTTTTTQMYTPIKSSYFGIDLLVKALEKEKEIFGDSNEYRPQIIIFITNPEQTEIIDTKLINKETASSYPIKDNEFFLYMDRDTGWKLNDYSLHPTSELKRYYGNDEEQKEWYKEWREKNSSINKQKALEINTITKQEQKNIKSTLIDSLNQFLDGDKYSREIKIEKGLISDGLIKLAGINPIRGPKYSITDKGLNLLKQAAQEEYDFEKDYIKARKSYLLDGISESEFQTGAPEEQGQMPKFSIFEKDGSELAQIEAKNSTDAKVKFFMENPEYEGSQSIEVKEVKATQDLKLNDYVKVVLPDNPYWNNFTGRITYIEGNKDFDTVVIKDENGKIQQFDRRYVHKLDKQIDSAYGETTTQGLDFPNQSVSPSTDIKVDTKGWVNMAGLKIKAAKITPKLLQLGGVLSKYLNSIQLSNDDENILIISGDAKLINDIEHEVRDIGLYCDAIDVTPDNSDRTYSLRIFLE